MSRVATGRVATSHWLFLIALAIFAAIELVFSLDWRMQHDGPLLQYASLLIHQFGRIPYREVFETSMPGSLLFNIGILTLLGSSDAAFRFADLTILGVLSWSTFLLLRPTGIFAALFAPVLFTLLYLSFGPEMSLQRDFLGIVLVSFATLFAVRGGFGAVGRSFVIGALFGAAACFKPHLTIGLPIVWWCSPKRQNVRSLVALAAGLTLPPLAALGWLYTSGGLPAFIEMATKYLPLHVSLTGDWHTLSGIERVTYTVGKFFEFGERPLMIVGGALGVYKITLNREHRPEHSTLLWLMFGYALYPVLSGQFWNYHWIPFFYFACLVSTLGIAIQTPRVHPLLNLVAVLCIVGSVRPASDMLRQLQGRSPMSPEGGRADRIAAVIESRSAPGEQIQVLDWAGGGIHALLLTKRPLATAFLYDYHFYHHTSDPFIAELRTRFVHQLQSCAPRLIIEVVKGKGTVTDPASDSTFGELRALLETRYHASPPDDGFIVYERNESALSTANEPKEFPKCTS